MKKLILGLFLSLGVLTFSNCVPASQWGQTMINVAWHKQGVPSQFHYGHIPKVLTRVQHINGVWTSTMFITFVPVKELNKYRNNPEQLPYFTLKFVQCNY